MDLAREGSPQIFALCGRGARSTLRILRHGLEVTEMAVSDMPGNPCGVWTVKKHRDDEYDTYIVVSFVNATMVLEVGETVAEAEDTGLETGVQTIAVGLLGEGSMVQVRFFFFFFFFFFRGPPPLLFCFALCVVTYGL